MELVNLATLPDADDFEIAPGIFFKKSDDWRIQYNQSEHELFNFSYNIDQGVSINRFPALKTLHKNLTYSFMPHLLNDRIKSYKTTKSFYVAVKNLVIKFLYHEQITNKTQLENIAKQQWIDLIRDSIRLAELNPKNGNFYFLESTIRLLSNWHKISQYRMLPTWCKLAYSSHEIIDKKDRKRIYELRDNEQGTWLPLEPDTLKSCFDKAKDYVEIYSKNIIEAHNIIKNRPRHNDKECKLTLVRKDGMTKGTFKKLQKLEIPKQRENGKPLFAIQENSKMVRSKGYASGFQPRTWLNIDEIRPQVIQLKRACIYIIAFFAGLRRREIAELPHQTPHYDGTYWWINIVRFKTEDEPISEGRKDIIPVPKIVADAINVLVKLFQHTRDELCSNYLIVSDKLTKKRYEKIKIATITKDIRCFTTEFSTECGHPHQLRKSIAWILISRDEKNIDLIRQLFGHKSFKMTLTYILSNKLLMSNIIELIELNYAEELLEVFDKIFEGELVGNVEKSIHSRANNKHFKGQILNTKLETFLDDLQSSGVQVYVSKLPIGAFCLTEGELKNKQLPCTLKNDQLTPQPKFCDYKNCPNILHSEESAENIRKQADYYRVKLNHLPDTASEVLRRYYQSEIEENIALATSIEQNLVKQRMVN